MMGCNHWLAFDWLAMTMLLACQHLLGGRQSRRTSILHMLCCMRATLIHRQGVLGLALDQLSSSLVGRANSCWGQLEFVV